MRSLQASQVSKRRKESKHFQHWWTAVWRFAVATVSHGQGTRTRGVIRSASWTGANGIVAILITRRSSARNHHHSFRRRSVHIWKTPIDPVHIVHCTLRCDQYEFEVQSHFSSFCRVGGRACGRPSTVVPARRTCRRSSQLPWSKHEVDSQLLIGAPNSTSDSSSLSASTQTPMWQPLRVNTFTAFVKQYFQEASEASRDSAWRRFRHDPAPSTIARSHRYAAQGLCIPPPSSCRRRTESAWAN
jgi:hypothetical protein